MAVTITDRYLLRRRRGCKRVVPNKRNKTPIGNDQEANEALPCPNCDYPIRRGPLKYMLWTRRRTKRFRRVEKHRKTRNNGLAWPKFIDCSFRKTEYTKSEYQASQGRYLRRPDRRHRRAAACFGFWRSNGIGRNRRIVRSDHCGLLRRPPWRDANAGQRPNGSHDSGCAFGDPFRQTSRWVHRRRNVDDHPDLHVSRDFADRFWHRKVRQLHQVHSLPGGFRIHVGNRGDYFSSADFSALWRKQPGRSH